MDITYLLRRDASGSIPKDSRRLSIDPALEKAALTLGLACPVAGIDGGVGVWFRAASIISTNKR